MKLELKKYRRTIGVDVASKKLDVSDSEGKLKLIVTNDVSSVCKNITSKIKEPEETLVVCEGTGGYEEVLVECMHEAGIAVAAREPSTSSRFLQRPWLVRKDRHH